MTKYYITPKGKNEPRIEVFEPNRIGDQDFFWASLASGTKQNSFETREWTLHTEQPTLAEVLAGLGENAYVVHPSDLQGNMPFVKQRGDWLMVDILIENGDGGIQDAEDISEMIDEYGYRIAFAGHGVDPESIPEEWRL